MACCAFATGESKAEKPEKETGTKDVYFAVSFDLDKDTVEIKHGLDPNGKKWSRVVLHQMTKLKSYRVNEVVGPFDMKKHGDFFSDDEKKKVTGEATLVVIQQHHAMAFLVDGDTGDAKAVICAHDYLFVIDEDGKVVTKTTVRGSYTAPARMVPVQPARKPADDERA